MGWGLFVESYDFRRDLPYYVVVVGDRWSVRDLLEFRRLSVAHSPLDHCPPTTFQKEITPKGVTCTTLFKKSALQNSAVPKIIFE